MEQTKKVYDKFLAYDSTWLYVLCMCVLILVDMTNVCTLCDESDKNDSISGQQ